MIHIRKGCEEAVQVVMFSQNPIQEIGVWFALVLDRAILFAFERTFL